MIRKRARNAIPIAPNELSTQASFKCRAFVQVINTMEKYLSVDMTC